MQYAKTQLTAQGVQGPRAHQPHKSRDKGNGFSLQYHLVTASFDVAQVPSRQGTHKGLTVHLEDNALLGYTTPTGTSDYGELLDSL
jgi:hypothetical protein